MHFKCAMCPHEFCSGCYNPFVNTEGQVLTWCRFYMQYSWGFVKISSTFSKILLSDHGN